MAQDPPVMTAMSPERVIQHAEIEILRRIGDNLEKLNNKMDNVQDRLTKIETQDALKAAEKVASALEVKEKEMDMKLDAANARVLKIELEIARFKGLTLPLYLVVTGFVSAIAAIAARTIMLSQGM